VSGRVEYHVYGELGLALAAFVPDDEMAFERALDAAGIELDSAPMSVASDGGLTVARLPTGDFQWRADAIQEQVTERIEACAR